ncbi:efflux transporter outer membrane subunit [Acidocella sp. MX-AZ03]|uniref:efflux transporter outer membrane subunit n=1 Tax=Acidocella sp. MX-AZ03 TaxID=2697363 RepID=UPI0022DD29D7|nr:efflux transporter outer membrane subunit [Acidocella sp. MX-AZ03]WBO59176.1 efflux transporter outer membrane subunit [Acidocella sp. MX-AZ03]
MANLRQPRFGPAGAKRPARQQRYRPGRRRPGGGARRCTGGRWRLSAAARAGAIRLSGHLPAILPDRAERLSALYDLHPGRRDQLRSRAVRGAAFHLRQRRRAGRLPGGGAGRGAPERHRQHRRRRHRFGGDEAQIETTSRIIASEQRLLTLLQGEYADGAIPQLDVLQQQSSILATQASLPALRTQAQQQRDRLAVLTGSLPASFTVPVPRLAELALPANIPVVLPSAYLQNRPDIRAALAQVAAQHAALGVAVAHMYPDLSLSATGGYAAELTSALFNTSSAFWLLAGNLLAPLYEGGTLRAHKQAAQAQLAGALSAYHGAVLNAFAQAADALSAVQNGQDALARASAAAQTADRAYHLAAAQYRLGAVDYTTVLTAQTQAAQAALSQIQARTTLLAAIATLQSAMAN